PSTPLPLYPWQRHDDVPEGPSTERVSLQPRERDRGNCQALTGPASGGQGATISLEYKGERPMDHSRLSMPLGEAVFTQRSIRRFKPDPIPMEDIHLIVEAAVRAPNGGNQQVARLLVVNDRPTIREFGQLYHEAWWAKRRDSGYHTFADLPANYRSAAGLADAIKDAPCIVFALATGNGPADSVIPAVQNLMLAARAIGIGSVPTTL